jgi:hypothetical protein
MRAFYFPVFFFQTRSKIALAIFLLHAMPFYEKINFIQLACSVAGVFRHVTLESQQKRRTTFYRRHRACAGKTGLSAAARI